MPGEKPFPPGGREAAVKAVIMAGGQGTRLKAVTGDTPKPMAPLLGRPMMEHILLLLKKQGFTEICATVKYRAEEIMSRFGDGSALGVQLQYRVEDAPLGTAGGVKNCADFWDGEDFLVISGDAACDFDLAELMRRHRESRAAVTLALCRNPEPLSYGLAVTDQAGLVRAFIEKPRWGRVVTDLVNTGIYIVSPWAMEPVPAGRAFDFAKDLFPLLLGRGELLLGVPMEGYWCDVGTPLSYYRCCVDALEGRLKLEPGGAFQTAPAAEEEEPPEEGAVCLDCAWRSRAELMGALSAAMLDLGADYSDGLRLHGQRFDLHIAPLAARSALRIAVSSEDTEFARELALSAKELAEALDNCSRRPFGPS